MPKVPYTEEVRLHQPPDLGKWGWYYYVTFLTKPNYFGWGIYAEWTDPKPSETARRKLKRALFQKFYAGEAVLCLT